VSGLAHTEIQGFVLRTYAMPALRVFVLTVHDPTAAGMAIAALIDGNPATSQIAMATPWHTPPDHCVNIGFTFAGLQALRLPVESLDSFPEDFRQGAAARAVHLGDVGRSAPEHWVGGLGSDAAHALVFLFAQTTAILERVSAQLRLQFASGGAFTELSAQDGGALPDNLAHFGYRDGFAQPTVEGGLPPALADPLPRAPAGEFVYGHPSQYENFTYPVPTPADLGSNGSFVAYRVLAQDCAGFEEFLSSASLASGMDRELIAAKVCGRWRNGKPLSLAPDSPDTDLPLERYNSFDYVPTEGLPDAFDDRKGYRCPIGAHIRRMNPRHSAVAGNSGLKRRVIRRGLPYGPPFDPAAPHDGIERGLLGLFIGVSLKDQFEFLMSDWANKGTFAPGLRDTRDPILGDNSGEDAAFLIAREGQKPVRLTGLSRFVTTRGGAYCFLPSATGLRHIAQVAANVAVPAIARTPEASASI
jgi:Dyp-type peroxidase family